MFDAMIGAIYDAPLADRPWADLAGRLRHQLGGTGTMFRFAPRGRPDGDNRFVFDAGWDARESWSLYDSIYRHLDPTSRRPMAVGTVYDFASLMPDFADPGDENARYARFCRSIGANHALFAYLGAYRGIEAWLSISRDDEAGAFGQGDVAMLAALLPHLSRAVDIHARLEAERTAGDIHASALADLGVGMILLDGAGAITGTNRLAETLLDRGTAVARDGDRLKVRGAGGSALRGSLRQGNAGSVIVAGDGLGDRLHLLVRAWDGDAGTGAGAAYVVYLDSPADRAVPRIDALRRHLGLSHAEARLAALLAGGTPLDEAAIVMGLTRASARTYCKRVLARTGATRQADLIRMVLTSLARLDRPH
ncbi:helix-turn-helix transcriptional regulator [Sphingomonas sp. KC8]|uniref:helix-turn-helix transcriptional regulator n=1 Tax=Sphingomonas sp. KC8 TaxID=1030157 RepID=UPI0002488A95|nr:hypothetical protein [Sphingomonas sp. KC8]ARS27496.1 hypothetical protein KC8_09355 [Sphingomonas sp. KC8]